MLQRLRTQSEGPEKTGRGGPDAAPNDEAVGVASPQQNKALESQSIEKLM